jgi:hypothetical protein
MVTIDRITVEIIKVVFAGKNSFLLRVSRQDL